MLRAIMCAAALLAAAGPAFADTIHVACAGPGQWSHTPRQSLSRHYPLTAGRIGIDGDVLLDCRVRQRGDLACEVRDEPASHWGFGEAALQVVREFRHSAIGANISVTVRFRA